LANPLSFYLLTRVLTCGKIIAMKYERVTKIQRNALIVQQHQEHPELSFKEIGNIFNISKQRVHQIVNRSKKDRCTEEPNSIERRVT